MADPQRSFSETELSIRHEATARARRTRVVSRSQLLLRCNGVPIDYENGRLLVLHYHSLDLWYFPGGYPEGILKTQTSPSDIVDSAVFHTRQQTTVSAIYALRVRQTAYRHFNPELYAVPVDATKTIASTVSSLGPSLNTAGGYEEGHYVPLFAKDEIDENSWWHYKRKISPCWIPMQEALGRLSFYHEQEVLKIVVQQIKMPLPLGDPLGSRYIHPAIEDLAALIDLPRIQQVPARWKAIGLQTRAKRLKREAIRLRLGAGRLWARADILKAEAKGLLEAAGRVLGGDQKNQGWSQHLAPDVGEGCSPGPSGPIEPSKAAILSPTGELGEIGERSEA